MPRYQIIEQRSYYEGSVIEAVDEEAAQRGDGTVIDNQSSESWSESAHSSEQVADDCEEVELP